MRWIAVFVLVVSTSVMAAERCKPATPFTPMLAVASERGPHRIELRITRNGKDLQAAWTQFLDRTFDFFDRDQNGTLTPAEVSRMITFPVPRSAIGKPQGACEFSIDFTELDTDKNGKATRAEFQFYCWISGLSAIAIEVEPASASDLKLSAVLMRRLDVNLDGRLTSGELALAHRQLRKFDLNEDEFVDEAELLQFADLAPPERHEGMIAQQLLKVAEDFALQFDVTQEHKVRVSALNDRSIRIVDSAAPGGAQQVIGRDARWIMTVPARQVVPDVSSAREFLVAQFRGVASNGDSLTKGEVAADGSLRNFGDLLRYADSNSDERLTVAELEAFAKLIQQGVESQVWIHVRDRGHNLFPMLDRDGDGRLSARELAAASTLAGFGGPDSGSVPLQFEVTLRGPSVSAWAGIPLPAARKRAAQPAPPRGHSGKTPPPWFVAADRNGDGVISPREFSGPPEAFRKLDADKNGVITPEEAGP